MREIKFRFFSNQEKRAGKSHSLWHEIHSGYEGESLNTMLAGCEALDIVPMQYTGLKDKNGVEIYEGDILDWGDWENGEGERAYVEYYDSCACFVLEFFSKWGGEGYGTFDDEFQSNKKLIGIEKDYKKTLEVIGNIYENPELINKHK